MSRSAFIVGCLAAGLMSLSGGAASAAADHGAVTVGLGTADAQAAGPDAAHGRYAVEGGEYNQAPFTQTSDTYACLSGLEAVGGGETADAGDDSETLNGAFPSTDGSRWTDDTNNPSAGSSGFEDTVVCAAVKKYQVVEGSAVNNPAGAHGTVAEADCPHGLVVLGGGGSTSSRSEYVAMATTKPVAHGWQIAVNNDSTGADTINAYAVCGRKLADYAIETRTTQTTAGQVADMTIECPTGTEPLSGGAQSTDGYDLNSSDWYNAEPGAGWQVVTFNPNANDTVTMYAICSKP